MIGGNIDLGEIFDTVFRYIVDFFNNFFLPIPVNFTNDLLVNQIHKISIILFILTVCMVIFFIYLLVNIILYIFSDKLINYFTNKYIKLYLSLNKQILAFEIVVVSF